MHADIVDLVYDTSARRCLSSRIEPNPEKNKKPAQTLETHMRVIYSDLKLLTQKGEISIQSILEAKKYKEVEKASKQMD